MNKNIRLYALLLCLCSGSLKAQSIMVMIDPNPSPYISDWENKKFASVIGEVSSSMDVICKVKAELYDGKGSLVAYTHVSEMPVLTMAPGINQYNIEDIFPLSAIKYKGNLEKTTLKTGKIPDDNYKFCVTLVDVKSLAPIGTSGTVCKMFNILAYQAPTLIAPTENEIVPETGVKGIVFRWTPVTPSPKTIVTYRLQVFEVMTGQSNMTALRNNQPIVEKDIKGMLQTQWPVEFAMPEAGKKYVWTVTPLDDEERKLVDGNGFAQPLGFTLKETATPSVNNYGINDEGIKRTLENTENVPGALITAEIWNEVQKTYTIIETKKSDHLGTYHFRNLRSGRYRLTAVLPGTLKDWIKKSEVVKPQTLHVNFQIEINSLVPILRGTKSGNNPLRFVSPDFLLDSTSNSVISKVFTSVNNYGINDEGIKKEIQLIYDTLSDVIHGSPTGIVTLVGYSWIRPCPDPPGGSEYFSYISDGTNCLIKYDGCNGVYHEWFYSSGYSENFTTYSSPDIRMNEAFNIVISSYKTLLIKKDLTRIEINGIMNPALEKASGILERGENKGKFISNYRFELIYRFEELKSKK